MCTYIEHTFFHSKDIEMHWVKLRDNNANVSGIYLRTGMMMGSMQLPVALAVHDSLGGSSSYCTLISQSRHLSRALPYFTSFSSGIGSWWQVQSACTSNQKVVGSNPSWILSFSWCLIMTWHWCWLIVFPSFRLFHNFTFTRHTCTCWYTYLNDSDRRYCYWGVMEQEINIVSR